MMPSGGFGGAMHAVLSSLTAALLFIHATFGCCWHHAHWCAQRSACIVAAEPEGCCEHHRSSAPGEQEKPCDCNVECEGTCTYLPPEKMQIEAPWVVASVDLVATAPALAEALVVSTSGSDSGDIAHAAPPLRLHLLHQLLLN
jgi:hypothetical protein